MRSWAAMGAAAVVCAAAVSCSGDAGGTGSDETSRLASATTTTTMPGAELRGTLQRSTLFETHRAFLLELRNEGDADRRIGSIQLSSPLFDAVPAQERDAIIDGGGRPVALPLPYGPARCDPEAAESDEPTELVTDIDGEEVRVELTVSPDDVLAELHDDECAAEAVLGAVDVWLGDEWETTAPRTITGDLLVGQRQPGVTATVEELQGNVIFSVEVVGGGAAELEVSDDRPAGGAEIVVSAARCDPHALTEYKRTFKFRALVRVGDDEPVLVDVEAKGAAHRALEELLASCLG